MNLPDPPVHLALQEDRVLTPIWKKWFIDLAKKLNTSKGIDTTVSLAKLTSGGTDGTMKFENGILTKYTKPT